VRSKLLALLLLFTLTACGSGGGAPADVDLGEDDGYAGALLEMPYSIAPVTLTDTDGEPFTLAKDTADLDIVFFGYTNCPDVCQVVMGNIASAFVRLDEADQERVRVVFVTTDPARDTAQEMTSYLSRFNPAFIGATGSLADINTLGKSMGIFIQKGKKLPSGGYEVDHTTSVTAVQQGKAPVVWTNGVSPKGMADDIEKLLEGA
jgi:protein SCO1/2